MSSTNGDDSPSAHAIAHVMSNARHWASAEMVLSPATRLEDIAPWLAKSWGTLLIGSGLDEFCAWDVDRIPETLADVARAYDRWEAASIAQAAIDAASATEPIAPPPDLRKQLAALEHERENSRIVGAEHAEWERNSAFVALWWRNAAGDVAAVFRASGGQHAAAALANIVRNAMTEPTAASLVERACWPVYRAHEAALAVLGPAFVAFGSMVCVATRGDRAAIAHVGHGRAFRIRDARCEQLTTDHVLADEGPFASLVTRAIGVREGFEIETHEVVREAGDVLLLCSRDVAITHTAAELARIVELHGRDAPRVIVDTLVAKANDETAAVVMVT